ncbi:hypothetical protein EDC18_101338 [Natranaerovirga pectinivora]|uniref:Mce-associated membrane protein n=1 Tax=Natranaerovirga pectinivora TaxID=682400 RepID=A0A4R3MQ90_9FIRM|nr:hypothetical protein [Natranaerovirga pectinivora]TCT17042.1 hypothetical protein EDC18_101338 [Natranaerovirga pectinivora]
MKDRKPLTSEKSDYKFKLKSFVSFDTIMFLIVVLIFISALIFISKSINERKGLVNEQSMVIDVVTKFGENLKNVPLLAPKEIVEESIKESYSNYVSQELLEKWLKDLLKAPGRIASSPWPDSIEVISVDKISNDTYKVNGRIIEKTSTGVVNDGYASKRPILFIVKRIDGKWVINDVL